MYGYGIVGHGYVMTKLRRDPQIAHVCRLYSYHTVLVPGSAAVLGCQGYGRGLKLPSTLHSPRAHGICKFGTHQRPVYNIDNITEAVGT